MKHAIATFDDVTEAFLSYSPPGAKGRYQLDRIKKLLGFLDNPQEKYKSVHIAGTSGKTSTAYFVRGMLEASGLRTGLTVSPHIISVNERVQIAGVPLEEQRFLAYVRGFLSLVEQTDLQPTYFELFVALAYWVFAKEKIDYAVIETGMGGLLDGTNVITRPDKVCVITDIGLDHTEVLGETFGEIAMQKAGIIHNGNHVIVRRQRDDVMAVIQAACADRHAAIEIVTSVMAPEFLPVFQHRNWAMAMATFDYIRSREYLKSLSPAQTNAVALQTPPGRWEMYRHEDKMIILDGAHNPQKLQALVSSLKAKGIDKCAVLMNLVEAPESKIRSSLDILKPFTSHLIIPEFNAGQNLKSRRSVPAPQLQEMARSLGYDSIHTEPDLMKALAMLLTRPEKVLLITGSLYLVSAVHPLIENVATRDG